MVFLLAPNTVYEFQVQAETEMGGGPFSTPRQFTTPEHGMIMMTWLKPLPSLIFTCSF